MNIDPLLILAGLGGLACYQTALNYVRKLVVASLEQDDMKYIWQALNILNEVLGDGVRPHINRFSPDLEWDL